MSIILDDAGAIFAYASYIKSNSESITIDQFFTLQGAEFIYNQENNKCSLKFEKESDAVMFVLKWGRK